VDCRQTFLYRITEGLPVAREQLRDSPRDPPSLWDLDSVFEPAIKLSRVRDKLLERAPAGVDLEPQNGTGAEDEGHEDHLRKRWVWMHAKCLQRNISYWKYLTAAGSKVS